LSGVVYGRAQVALLTAAEASALDARARSDGVPERALMENAGRAAAQVIHRLYPEGRVVAVVGRGNNGGDALVALRSLRTWGRDVAFVTAGPDDPDLALLTGYDIPRLAPDAVDSALASASVLVDGILGTGARGAPREPAATLIGQMNASGRPIVALDIPSGVDPTTAEVPGVAVDAVATVMFGWPKMGSMFQPGRARCGRLIAVEIGFPPLREDDVEEAGAAVITPDWARVRVPVRPPDAHKTSVGRVLIVAGRKGMAGAAAIAGHSAMRAGAGYVRVASVEPNRAIVQTLAPEALFVDRTDDAALREAVAESDAVLIGPALGTDMEGAATLDMVLDVLDDRGCVLDADALTILAGRRRGFRELGDRVLITPHPGEMSRIVKLDVDRVRADPVGQARKVAEENRLAVLLKGAPSVVAAAGRPTLVSSVGSSDLATAAMGDQLGATAATFLAAGLDPSTAGGLALFYGGRAADLAARGRSLTPHDVAGAFHLALEDPGPDRSPLDLPFFLFDQPARW
jgi:ADP-dependent NAD(P)H-hydrate dehydratase / NAD(P)H-hydrate epimerase